MTHRRAVANWVSDTWQHSPACAGESHLSDFNFSFLFSLHPEDEGKKILKVVCVAARTAANHPASKFSSFEPKKTIGESHLVLVDATPRTGNNYQAWPFFSYLHNNPDEYTGLGKDVMRQLMLQYKVRSNETPLHTLQRVSTQTSVAKVVGKYWARMAYLDIGNPMARAYFFALRPTINTSILDSSGAGSYRVKDARKPRYMGANIIPLKSPSKTVTVNIKTSGQLTSHLVARNTRSNVVRYIELAKGTGSIDMADGEEASLVVANTPETLALYTPNALAYTPDVNTGVDYSFTLSGAKA